jgi:4-carboxymuconolactone decarboxylase
MARVPYPSRDQLDAGGQQLYDRLSKQTGKVMNGYRALLNSPRLAVSWSVMGRYVRFESPLVGSVEEIVCLAVSRELDGQYMWSRHEPEAIQLGVSDQTIETLRNGKDPDDLTHPDSTIVRFTQEMLRNHRVSDETFASVKKLLGTQGCVELAAMVGFMAAFSLLESALDVELEPEFTPTLPHKEA